MVTILAVLALLLLLAPPIGILFSARSSDRARIVWSLAALSPLPLAIGGWVAAIAVLKPAGGLYSNYAGLAALLALVGPWLVFWLFRRAHGH